MTRLDAFNDDLSLQIDRDISEREYRTGNADEPAPPSVAKQPIVPRVFATPLQRSESSRQFKSPAKLPVKGQRILPALADAGPNQVEKQTIPEQISAKSFYGESNSSSRYQEAHSSALAKLPSDVERSTKVKSSGLYDTGSGEIAKPRYDPNETGSIVMARPNAEHQKFYNPKRYVAIQVRIEDWSC